MDTFEIISKQKRGTQCRDRSTFSATWDVEGSKTNHHAFIQHMLNDAEVEKFEF